MISGRLALLACLLGCASASEGRVAALEAEFHRLEETEQHLAELRSWIAKVETGNRLAVEKLEQRLQNGAAPATAAPTPAPAPAPAAPPSGHPDDTWQLVDAALGLGKPGVQVRGNDYTVSLAWLSRQLEGSGAKGIKLMPNKKRARLVLKGIKPGSLLMLLGLRNNDLLLTVAGAEPSSVAELGQALRGATSPLELIVQRGPKEVLLRYVLAP